jgi:hypothetical protein
MTLTPETTTQLRLLADSGSKETAALRGEHKADGEGYRCTRCAELAKHYSPYCLSTSLEEVIAVGQAMGHRVLRDVTYALLHHGRDGLIPAEAGWGAILAADAGGK